MMMLARTTTRTELASVGVVRALACPRVVGSVGPETTGALEAAARVHAHGGERHPRPARC